MEHQELTEGIIGCAFRVYNKLGYGFLESVYEKALLIELKKVGLEAESQKPITVFYEDEIVGEFKADIIVRNLVIVELKSVTKIVKAREIQLVNYLVATGRPVGLLLNFGEDGLGIKRKVKDLKRENQEP